MSNRLADATSPYLLQHADNPVDWRPWGEEAFAEARRRDVPVLLSVGYAACHWCHVMAHESFEDPATAERMNDGFVNVKVDREERPDVDAVYMEAVQAMTGQGGWPMTAFLTPDGAPFYCGTYFPRDHFNRLLEAVARVWREERDGVLDQGRRVVDALAAPRTLGEGQLPGAEEAAAAVEGLARDFDARRGGFGGAPKFPPSMLFTFLLAHHRRTGDERALLMARTTAEAMARGGIHDQIGGGFARYSVDADWTVPHFEKMLYDNALLLRAYLRLWRETGDVLARRTALGIADWMVTDLLTSEGGFASALDADSEGEEGRYYVWSPAELERVLGPEDGAWAAGVFGVTDEGTFEHGTSVLRLPEDPDDPERFERVRRALLAERARRVPPARDDKVVAAWNGLAVAALAEAGALLDRPDLVERARTAARLLADLHMDGGRIARTSRDGAVGASAGVLEDYADAAEGFLALFSVTGEQEWTAAAGRLLDTVLDRFTDASGAFYDTADDAEALINRPQDPTDNAVPSGRFAAAGALLTYSGLTGSQRHRRAAESALGPVVPLAAKAPRFAGWGLAVTETLLSGPLEVAVVGPGGEGAEITRELHRTALMTAPFGTAVAPGDGGAPDDPEDAPVPLLAGRPLIGGGAAAYVCRGFTCDLPVRDAVSLQERLTP
ncbi:thioredoxin domain-containing protein [Nocardiopsis suaedae]|uniref:Thioredoxin domain-containing protein n=1 Tax=Nocardiopsis suaedae TaxID=3018444 RepID=A0ABT4TFN0_9ACTN|nr:thioredoxin domain-containing protein [Nocardiopsis suaedae]MDA2803151.1 thioredoxin domain-containing protein [Nocardiopsis suaedae]